MVVVLYHILPHPMKIMEYIEQLFHGFDMAFSMSVCPATNGFLGLSLYGTVTGSGGPNQIAVLFEPLVIL